MLESLFLCCKYSNGAHKGVFLAVNATSHHDTQWTCMYAVICLCMLVSLGCSVVGVASAQALPSVGIQNSNGCPPAILPMGITSGQNLVYATPSQKPPKYYAEDGGLHWVRANMVWMKTLWGRGGCGGCRKACVKTASIYIHIARCQLELQNRYRCSC